MRRVLPSLALASLFTVSAIQADDKTLCATSDDSQVVVAACGRVIAGKDASAEIRASALTNRGGAKQKLKDYDGAIADLTEAITLMPNLSAAFFNRGVTYYRKNDAKHAMADFTEAIRLDPKDISPLVNRGILHFDLDDNAHAIADFDAAIKLAPKSAILYTYRAKIHLDSGDAKRAGADFKRVLELDPTNEEAKAMLRDLGMGAK